MTDSTVKRVQMFLLAVVGGAEKMSLKIAEILREDAWDIEYVVIKEHPTDNIEQIQRLIGASGSVRIIEPHSQYDYLCQLRSCLKDSDASIVFCSAMHLNLRLLLLSFSLRGKRYIVRNENYLFTVSSFRRRVIGVLYRRASAVISQTEEMTTELIDAGVPSNRIITLHNYVEKELIRLKSEEFSAYGPDRNDVKFVAVGRVCPQKGFDILLQAFDIVIKQVPDAHLHIVGDTSYENGRTYTELCEMCNEMGITDAVTFHGFRSNPYPFIKQADVYVLSSRYEGLPNVLLEANALSVPIAAVKCIPIISRMVVDGKNGYLAQSDNPVSLADAMLKAIQLRDPEVVFRAAEKEDFQCIFDKVLNGRK